MRSKMTLDRLAEIIERTVAKKEDIEAIRTEMATKKDVAALRSDIGDLAVKHDRLDMKVDQIKELVEENEKDHLHLKTRVGNLEKQTFVGSV